MILDEHSSATAEVDGKKQEQEDIRAAIQETTNKVLEEASRASKLRKTVDDTQQQLPSLNEAKKLAASSRNFKEARRLAGEIKELSEQLEDVSAQLQQCEETKKAMNENLDTMNADCAQLEKLVEAEESQADEKLMQELSDLYAALFVEKRRAARRAEPQQFLLQADFEATEFLLEQLCVKHDKPLPSPPSTVGTGGCGCD